MTLEARRSNLIIPGRMSINWRHPLAKDLTFFKLHDSLSPAAQWSPKAAFNMALVGTDWSIKGSAGGPGLTNTTGTDYARDANCAFQMASRGSIFAYTTPFFSPTDSLEHAAFLVGETNATSGSTPGALHVIKYSDNNWYIGHYHSGADNRIIVAASGTFTSGVPMMCGATWVMNGTTTAYVAGKQIGTHASPASAPAAFAGVFLSGFDDGSAYAWAHDGATCQHYHAIWDIDLNAEQVKYLNYDPWCFVEYGS